MTLQGTALTRSFLLLGWQDVNAQNLRFMGLFKFHAANPLMYIIAS